MAQPTSPRLYLVTPPAFEAEAFLPLLASVLDAGQPRAEIACLRLSSAGAGETALRRAAEALRRATEAHDLALVIENHWRLVEPHGLDGVHLGDGPRGIREARKALGPDRIVGAHCGASRHAGMVAAEFGADYVAFGPFAHEGALGPERLADAELIRWWAEMIETPVVAEGGLSREIIAELGTAPDFLALGAELWAHPDGPVAALRALPL
ncbi:MAG TPA: thiamine phosphate synthase [Paracoccaceae bacterium]|nr:thiamine phosphate synthase [Paracoccaceae bacterium]